MDENTKAIVASNLTAAFYASRKAKDPEVSEIISVYRQILAAADEAENADDNSGESEFVGALPDTGWAR